MSDPKEGTSESAPEAIEPGTPEAETVVQPALDDPNAEGEEEDESDLDEDEEEIEEEEIEDDEEDDEEEGDAA